MATLGMCYGAFPENGSSPANLVEVKTAMPSFYQKIESLTLITVVSFGAFTETPDE